MELKEKILKEIDYMLETHERILKATDNAKDPTTEKAHIMALGSSVGLADLKYSIINNKYLFEGVKK